MNTQEAVSLPKYQCHKVVEAGKIRKIDLEPNGNGGAILGFESTPTDQYADIIVTQDFLDKHKPVIGGYYVVYEDGHDSFSPAEAFEKGYSLAENSTGGKVDSANITP